MTGHFFTIGREIRVPLPVSPNSVKKFKYTKYNVWKVYILSEFPL